MRVLIADDHHVVRRGLLFFLKTQRDIEVVGEASNGKEAVEHAENRQYDLILMDIRMPEMDGYEATSHIRKLPGYKDIPILALTADKNQEARQVGPDNQFNDMLTKPFEPRDLKQSILHHLSNSNKDRVQPNGIIKDHSREKSEETKTKNSIDSHWWSAATHKEENLTEPTFEISRYEKISGGNKAVLEKLITNAQKAFETYSREFAIAAGNEDLQGISDLVHKNTTSVHYVQANRLAEQINEFRSGLNSPEKDKEKLKELRNSIEREFKAIIEGLIAYLG